MVGLEWLSWNGRAEVVGMEAGVEGLEWKSCSGRAEDIGLECRMEWCRWSGRA